MACSKKMSKKNKRLIKKGRKEQKVADVMEEYKKGELEMGKKGGKKVKKRSQVIAIALSEAKRMKKKRK